MNLKKICIAINALFCLGCTYIAFWAYNRDAPWATVLGLICLPVIVPAGLGWRTAKKGRGLPVTLFLSGAMILYGIWLYFIMGHAAYCFPGLLGLSNLCLLPLLKKRTDSGFNS